MTMDIDISKLAGVLGDQLNKIAARVLRVPVDEVYAPDLDEDDRIRVRAAWRHYLSRLGVTWKYSPYGNFPNSEGCVSVADEMTDKGTTTLFIPNAVAEKAIADGCLPNQEDIPRKASSKKVNADGTLSTTTGETIMRAARNKTEYCNLSSVEASEDGRRIVFNFANDTSFSWSVVEFKFFHGDTGLEFGQSHFGNIVWGTDATGNLIRPGLPSFFSTIQSRCKQGWVNNFFRILSLYINKRVEDHRREGAFRLAEKRLNRLDTMIDRDLIWPIESLAKNNFVAQMNLDNLCKQVFKGTRVLSFKEMQESGLDKWFFSHVGESVAPRYLRNDNNHYNMEEDVYAGDENRQYILGNYMDSYRRFVREGMGDLFRYVWEKHRYPLCSQEWKFDGFKQCFNFLVGLGYDYKRLMDYLFDDLDHQGLGQHIARSCEEMTLIRDYARMAEAVVGRDFDRYPRHLKTAHDIVMRNYRVNKSQVLSKRYADMVESLKGMEYKGEEYSVVVPATLDLIVKEGQSLNHCVANYIEGLVAGEYSILFLRKNDDLEKSLVTLQVQGERIVQAKGVNNRPVSREEKEVMDKYVEQLAKQKELPLALEGAA
jgi:hypothetical protein